MLYFFLSYRKSEEAVVSGTITVGLFAQKHTGKYWDNYIWRMDERNLS